MWQWSRYPCYLQGIIHYGYQLPFIKQLMGACVACDNWWWVDRKKKESFLRRKTASAWPWSITHSWGGDHYAFTPVQCISNASTDIRHCCNVECELQFRTFSKSAINTTCTSTATKALHVSVTAGYSRTMTRDTQLRIIPAMSYTCCSTRHTKVVQVVA